MKCQKSELLWSNLRAIIPMPLHSLRRASSIDSRSWWNVNGSQLEVVQLAHWHEWSEGCPVLSFDLFYHCVPRFPHIWTEVSSKLSTNMCTKHAWPMSNSPFCMYQLWTVICSDLKEGLEGCPVLSFGLFSPPRGKIFPHLNFLLQCSHCPHLKILAGCTLSVTCSH